MIKDYDELQTRYIAAIDEIAFVAEKLGQQMGMTSEFETAKNRDLYT